jgi:hypothetical protein
MDRDIPNTVSEQPGDDLTAIKGIGPESARRLHDAGVRSFADFLRYSPSDLADKARVSLQHVKRYNWIGQARELAKMPSPVGNAESEASGDNGEHPESFVLRLTLDADNKVVRTVVQHATSKRETPPWVGWDTDRLLAFLSEYVNLGGEREEAPSVSAAVPESGPQPAQPAGTTPEPEPSPPIPPLPHEIHVREVDVTSIVSGTSQRSFIAREPFAVRLAFDSQPATSASGEPLGYAVDIFARTVGERRRHIQAVGKHEGTVDEAGAAIVEIRSTGLPSGTYRLEGTLRLYEPSSSRPHRLAALEGGLFEVTNG